MNSTTVLSKMKARTAAKQIVQSIRTS